MVEERVTFCRFCHALCGVTVKVDGDRVLTVEGDKDNSLFQGFTCVKGRHLPEQHHNPERLLSSVRRDGEAHRPIASDQALDEIAEKLSAIIREHGPRAVALYAGTYSFVYPTSIALAMAFMEGVGSPMFFSPLTIDQAAKTVAGALHGRWGAPPHSLATSDAWMLIGTNPIVSMLGAEAANPNRRLLEAVRRGAKVIVIDPRRTESAALATLHLQVKPGEDATLLAGMLRHVITEDLYDREFVAAEVEGLEALAQAVQPFTLDYVERRAGVAATQVTEAARLFAIATRAFAAGGTGINMAPHPNLSEYLVHALITLCGHWPRAGERVANPRVLMPVLEARAQALPKPPLFSPLYGDGVMRNGQRASVAGLPVSGLADEILIPGEGQVRALLSVGGNPMVAWPDPAKTDRALENLDLSVAIDIKMSATARRCDYVLAPKLSLETPATTMSHENDVLITTYGGAGWPEPYAQYTPAVVDPPAGADVLEEWEMFYGLAQRMGIPLIYRGFDGTQSIPLDMSRKPTSDELLEIISEGGRVPLSEVKRHPHGAFFPDPPAYVQPKDPACTERLDVGHPLMMAELAQVAEEPVTGDGAYSTDARFGYRLICRRLRNVYNSSGRDIDGLLPKFRYNPAYMHPKDLAAEGLEPGATIEILGETGAILGIAQPDDTVRRGVISMTHAYGDLNVGENMLHQIGSTTAALASSDQHIDAISGMPRQSAIPVNIRRLRHQTAVPADA